MLNATLTSNNEVVSTIGPGLMVLCGITHSDNILDVESLVPKLLKTRLWGDDTGKGWAKNVVEHDAQILLVSQFTLYHKLKGTKPDFHDAMNGDEAKELYNSFLGKLSGEFIEMRKKAKIETSKVPVLPGSFGNYMNISMTNDGPVTLVIDSVKDPRAVKKMEAMAKRGQGKKN